MRMAVREGVEIDYCPNCRGIWLDKGELDKLMDRAASHAAPAAPLPPPPPPSRPRDPEAYDFDDGMMERSRQPRDRRYDDDRKRYDDDRKRYDDDRKRYDDDRRYDDSKKRKRGFLDDIFDIFD